MHLTLGVAVLGSLLGGVQLFAMIKMLGLQIVDIEEQYKNRPDINQQQNIWAAYQVSKNTIIYLDHMSRNFFRYNSIKFKNDYTKYL